MNMMVYAGQQCIVSLKIAVKQDDVPAWFVQYMSMYA